MPMRNEIVPQSSSRREFVIAEHRAAAATRPAEDLLLLTAFCLAGAVGSLYLSATVPPFNQLSLLIVQANLF
ncbi:MAG TPA: hypothetical protein VMC05_08040 [Xanthobacteraceae bacterium]|nr:hypothetical protein [Xanthobacteraceae bacterium]